METIFTIEKLEPENVCLFFLVNVDYSNRLWIVYVVLLSALNDKCSDIDQAKLVGSDTDVAV